MEWREQLREKDHYYKNYVADLRIHLCFDVHSWKGRLVSSGRVPQISAQSLRCMMDSIFGFTPVNVSLGFSFSFAFFFLFFLLFLKLLFHSAEMLHDFFFRRYRYRV